MKRPAEYFTKAEEALKRARVVRQAKPARDGVT